MTISASTGWWRAPANLRDLKQKLGVFWHTQGSGKSYSMVFLCQKILRKYGGGVTVLVDVCGLGQAHRFVALDKPTAVRMYDRTMRYWPDYIVALERRIEEADNQQQALQLRHHLQRVKETEVCVVV